VARIECNIRLRSCTQSVENIQSSVSEQRDFYFGFAFARVRYHANEKASQSLSERTLSGAVIMQSIYRRMSKCFASYVRIRKTIQIEYPDCRADKRPLNMAKHLSRIMSGKYPYPDTETELREYECKKKRKRKRKKEKRKKKRERKKGKQRRRDSETARNYRRRDANDPSRNSTPRYFD